MAHIPLRPKATARAMSLATCVRERRKLSASGVEMFMVTCTELPPPPRIPELREARWVRPEPDANHAPDDAAVEQHLAAVAPVVADKVAS